MAFSTDFLSIFVWLFLYYGGMGGIETTFRVRTFHRELPLNSNSQLRLYKDIQVIEPHFEIALKYTYYCNTHSQISETF